MPAFVKKYEVDGELSYPDFTKRITALRETFEESNILIGRRKGGQSAILSGDTSKTHLRTQYTGEFKSNFIDFCLHEQIEPSIDKLYAYCRIASPVGFFPANDAQCYMYFCDNDPIDDHLQLN